MNHAHDAFPAGHTYSPSQVETNLRIAFGDEDLRATSVYADIRAWEAARSSFRILPDYASH